MILSVHPQVRLPRTHGTPAKPGSPQLVQRLLMAAESSPASNGEPASPSASSRPKQNFTYNNVFVDVGTFQNADFHLSFWLIHLPMSTTMVMFITTLILIFTLVVRNFQALSCRKLAWIIGSKLVGAIKWITFLPIPILLSIIHFVFIGLYSTTTMTWQMWLQLIEF